MTFTEAARLVRGEEVEVCLPRRGWVLCIVADRLADYGNEAGQSIRVRLLDTRAVYEALPGELR